MPLNVTIGPLALFALVASITPGPNNLLLMRSGAQFGVRRTLWHLSGVEAGFVGLMLLSYLGIGALLLALPLAFVVLRWACFAYLIWLAIAILRDARVAPDAAGKPMDNKARPMSFVEGLMFQLINPKAWMMAVTVVSAFYGDAAPSSLDVTVATLISVAIGTPCMLIWTGWGAAIDHVLTQPRARQAFGYFMSVLVLATALWMLH